MKHYALAPDGSAGRSQPIQLWRTENMFERLRGLLGRAALRPGEAFLIEPCNMVHTVGMAYPIDVVFVDRRGLIRRICPAVPAWRLRTCLRARAVIELAAGEAQRRAWREGQSLNVAEAAE